MEKIGENQGDILYIYSLLKFGHWQIIDISINMPFKLRINMVPSPLTLLISDN